MSSGLKARSLNLACHSCRYHDLWELYKKAVASFWTVEEVDLSQDMRDWERLTGQSIWVPCHWRRLDAGKSTSLCIFVCSCSQNGLCDLPAAGILVLSAIGAVQSTNCIAVK